MLKGWEEFDEPVDRIVSIGAFEHFGFDRYDDFFKLAYEALPDDGVMLLHTITALTGPQMVDRGMPLTFNFARFVKFMITEIFPGGRLPSIEKVEDHSSKAGFTLTRRQSLQPHYARTLDIWAENLEAKKDEAIAIQSEEVYERYMKYLTGLRGRIPGRLHRRQPVHTGEVNGRQRPRPRRRSDQSVGEVRAHYDLSNEFFQLFTDPTVTYSCAYFPREDMTMDEAQIAKLDLSLGKLGLKPGMTLLDIGCGWGSLMKRALEKYDVNVVV